MIKIKYEYKGKKPFKKTDIVYGVRDIKIDKTSYDDDYIYQMPERARFKRLRVELGKKLMEIQKKIY